MRHESPFDRVLEELRFALAQANASVPPTALRTRVLTVAQSERTPGRPLTEPPAITPVEAYRRTVEALSILLQTLSDDEWGRPVLRDLSVQELVGHLIGVERAFQAVSGIDGSAVTASDHVAGTQADALANGVRDPADTYRDWLARATRTLHYLEAADPTTLAEPVSLHGFTLPITGMLVVRSFEMWTHEEDVRRATGRSMLAPDASRLALMTDLVMGALPRALVLAGGQMLRRTARIVLTGPGGGTWQTALDGGVAAAAADVLIVTDATSFCRLVANRLAPDAVHATIGGDETLGRQLLASVPALALD